MVGNRMQAILGLPAFFCKALHVDNMVPCVIGGQ